MTDERKPPKIEDAPGLVWRPRKNGWVATWQARTDIVKLGYGPQTARLWDGTEPTDIEAKHIATQCRRLQADMLLFKKTGEYVTSPQTLTLGDLINKFQTDEDSRYHKRRHHVRLNTDSLLKRISKKHGAAVLSELNSRILISWHRQWSADGKISMGHAFISILRTMFSFGMTILENEQCERLSLHLHKLQFPMGEPRTAALTAEQATLIRNKAREFGLYSIALGQALQFDLILRQKDVIGEWVPVNEPGVSDVICPQKGKWLRGLRWSEIDENQILRHVTSKKSKPLVLDLKLAPMVQEEFQHVIALYGKLPMEGPIVNAEGTGMPFVAGQYRRKWRMVAEACGVPKNVWNMDSRSGAITEATDAGIDIEHVRHAATHSNVSMTARYSRGAEKKVANVQKLRVEHRNKPRTDDN